jgi:predicted nucleotidyltransferase
MTREEFFEKIAAHRPELDAMGIKSIGVFGSVACNEARPDSDVDVLVEFNRRIGLFEFAGVQRRLSELLGVRVDLTTPNGIKPRLRERILAEARHAASAYPSTPHGHP